MMTLDCNVTRNETPDPAPPSAPPPVPNRLGTDVVTCRRCGFENPHGVNTCGRCRSFVRGTLAAVTHALRATHLPADLAYLPAEIDAWMGSVLTDEGEPDDVPTRRRALLEYRGRLHRRIVQLDTALELRGLIDKRGKLRVAWLQQLASLIASAKGIDSLLGLERRARSLSVGGPASYLAARSGGSAPGSGA